MCCGSYKWITPTVKQTWVVFPMLLFKISLGMTFGYSTVFLSAIKAPDSTLKMDIHTSSWFVSLLGIALLIGYFACPWMMDRYGRKKASLLNTIPSVMAFIVMIVSDGFIALMLARFLSGISLGGFGIMAGVLIGEFTSPQNRGMFLNFGTAYLNLGSLLVHFLGNYVSWRVLAILIPVPVLIAIFIIYTWTESPSWLVERGEYEKSREAFYWLRGRTEETTKEIEELIRAQSKIFVKEEKSIKEQLIDFCLKFKKKNFLKPLLITVLLSVLSETSGRHILPAYAVQLTEEISADLNMLFFISTIDVLVVVSSIVASFLIRFIKLRTLLFSTGFVTFIILCSVSLSLYLLKVGVVPTNYAWVTLTLFGAYCVSTNLACTCTPFLLFGELFPLEHRAVGCMIIGNLASLVITAALKIIPYVVAACDTYGALGILAVSLVLSLIPLYFVLPETKDRTLQEIEDYYENGKFRDGEMVPGDDHDDESRALKKADDMC